METTAARIDAILPHLRVCTGVPEPGWHSVATIVRDELVAGWLDTVEQDVGSRDVATSFLGSWIAAPVVTASVAAVLLEARAPGMAPDSAYLHPHPGGWFDGVAFADPGYAVLPEDPAARRDPRARVVADRAALRDVWARAIVAVVSPLLEAVASHGRFGRRGLWGNGVVDRALGTATELARGGAGHFGDAEDVIAEASALLAAIAPLAPVSLPPARILPVAWHHRSVPFLVKSCCCLLYKTVAASERRPSDYCTGCPLIDGADRAARWSRWLDEQG